MAQPEPARESTTARPEKGLSTAKLEAVVIPVSNVDPAKEFYGRLGWRLDADFAFDNGFRVVQFTRCRRERGRTESATVRMLLSALYLSCCVRPGPLTGALGFFSPHPHSWNSWRTASWPLRL